MQTDEDKVPQWSFLKKFCSDWNSCNSNKQWDRETHTQLHGLVKFSLDLEHFLFFSDSTQRTTGEIGRNNPVKRGRTKWTFTKLHTAQNWRRWMFCKVGNWFLDFTNIYTIVDFLIFFFCITRCAILIPQPHWNKVIFIAEDIYEHCLNDESLQQGVVIKVTLHVLVFR